MVEQNETQQRLTPSVRLTSYLSYECCRPTRPFGDRSDRPSDRAGTSAARRERILTSPKRWRRIGAAESGGQHFGAALPPDRRACRGSVWPRREADSREATVSRRFLRRRANRDGGRAAAADA